MRTLLISALVSMALSLSLVAQANDDVKTNGDTSHVEYKKPYKKMMMMMKIKLKWIMKALTDVGIEHEQAKKAIENMLKNKMDEKAEDLKKALEEVGVETSKAGEAVAKIKEMKKNKLDKLLHKAAEHHNKHHKDDKPAEEEPKPTEE